LEARSALARSRAWSGKGKREKNANHRTPSIHPGNGPASCCHFHTANVGPRRATPVGRVAYHFVARLLQSSPSGPFFVIGYVNFLDGVSAPLFDGAPGEKTAVMTFRSDLFSAAPLFNGNVVVLNWPSTPAPVVKFYLNNSPNQDWNQPDSFSSGQLIGSFSARVGQIVITGFSATAPGGTTAVVTYSYDWVSTRDFSLGGKMYNLGRLSPGGGTISNYASAVPVPTTVPGFPTALTSAGTSFVIGQSARTGQ
jgi:hypothetical protein